MRRVISLDPDYIPWDDKMVRLRKKKSKAVGLLALFLVILALGFGVYQKETAKRQDALQRQQQAAAQATATAQAAPQARVAFECPPPVGEPGLLTLIYNDGCAVSRIPCNSYQVGNKVGRTESGPVVNISDRDVVMIMCDDQKIEFNVPE